MSDVRRAVLRDARAFGCSRWLRFELSDDRPLPFRGGQYVIIDTGLKLDDGRARKRAYSMLSPDSDSQHFELGVYRLAGGEGAEYLNTLELGTELRFTGPWGKLHVPEDLAQREGPIWMVATDSGPSAALGLLRSTAMAPLLSRVQCWHLRTHPDAFLSDTFLTEACGQLHGAETSALRCQPLASVQAPMRVAELEHWLKRRLEESRPAQVYVTGDGVLIRKATEQLMAAGIPEEHIQTESFFNQERKLKPAPQTA